MAVITSTRVGAAPFTAGYDDSVDDEFALGAARYLRNNGLDTATVRASLMAELGLDAASAQRYADAA